MNEIIEGHAVRIDDEPAQILAKGQWHGDFPFFLVIEPDDKTNGNVGIDLDEPGWVATHAEFMRTPGTWVLFHKESTRAVFGMVVEQGDQPYFTKHHVGNLMAGSQITTVGIGKKGRDGEMTRLWLLPNGIVCGGEDVDILAARMIG
jgi:hypothetical protein